MTAGSFLDGRWRPLGDLHPVVENIDAVRQLHDHFQLVLDQQDGQSPLLKHRDQRLHFGGFGRIHPRSRLVQQQQARPQRQRPRDFNAPSVRIRKAIG